MGVVFQANTIEHGALKEFSFGNSNFGIENLQSVEDMLDAVVVKAIHGKLSFKCSNWPVSSDSQLW